MRKYNTTLLSKTSFRSFYFALIWLNFLILLDVVRTWSKIGTSKSSLIWKLLCFNGAWRIFHTSVRIDKVIGFKFEVVGQLVFFSGRFEYMWQKWIWVRLSIRDWIKEETVREKLCLILGTQNLIEEIWFNKYIREHRFKKEQSNVFWQISRGCCWIYYKVTQI